MMTQGWQGQGFRIRYASRRVHPCLCSVTFPQLKFVDFPFGVNNATRGRQENDALNFFSIFV